MKPLAKLNHHNSRVWCVAAHPSLPYLATCSEDKQIIIYDIESYSIVTILSEAHVKSTRWVAWKPSIDIPCLACGSFDGTVSVWAKTDDKFGSREDSSDASDADDEGRSSNPAWSLMAIIEGHENEVKCVDWSWDGTYLASCSRDKTVWVWETDEYNDEFECVHVLQEYHTQDVKHVSWGPDQRLLTGSYDDSVKVFREEDGEMECVADLAGDSTVWSVDWEGRGTTVNTASKKNRFVSAQDDGKVCVWKCTQGGSVESWVIEKKVDCGDMPVYSVSWGSNGKIVAAGAMGAVIVIGEGESEGDWRIEQQQDSAHGVFEVNCVAWIGDKVVSGGDNGGVVVWEL